MTGRRSRSRGLARDPRLGTFIGLTRRFAVPSIAFPGQIKGSFRSLAPPILPIANIQLG